MINIFKENKKLKKEIEELQTRYDKMCNEEDRELFNLNYYNNRIDKLLKEVNELKGELTELYEKNYELAKRLKEVSACNK